MLDPVVVFLQSKVDNRLRLAAEGWGPKVPWEAKVTAYLLRRQMRPVEPPQLDWRDHYLGRVHREIQRRLRANPGHQAPG